jgi:predicted component of type VI protein secretion system
MATKARRKIDTIAWRGVLALVAAIASTMVATPVEAVPPGVTFAGANPVDGSTLFVARTAADNPLDPPTFQLKATVQIDNNGSADREVDAITVSYPGSGITPQPQDVAIRWTVVNDPNDPTDERGHLRGGGVSEHYLHPRWPNARSADANSSTGPDLYRLRERQSAAHTDL